MLVIFVTRPSVYDIHVTVYPTDEARFRVICYFDSVSLRSEENSGAVNTIVSDDSPFQTRYIIADITKTIRRQVATPIARQGIEKDKGISERGCELQHCRTKRTRGHSERFALNNDNNEWYYIKIS